MTHGSTIPDTRGDHTLRSRSRRREARGKRLARGALGIEDQEQKKKRPDRRSIDRKLVEDDGDLRTQRYPVRAATPALT